MHQCLVAGLSSSTVQRITHDCHDGGGVKMVTSCLHSKGHKCSTCSACARNLACSAVSSPLLGLGCMVPKFSVLSRTSFGKKQVSSTRLNRTQCTHETAPPAQIPDWSLEWQPFRQILSALCRSRRFLRAPQSDVSHRSWQPYALLLEKRCHTSAVSLRPQWLSCHTGILRQQV